MATPTQFRNEAPTPDRPRALALVEAQIPEAEADRDRWLTVVAALTATKQPCRRENAMLRWAEERVALLHRSRAILEAEAAGHGAVIGRRKAKPTPPEN